MTNDEIQHVVRSALVANVPDLAKSVRQAYSLYAIVNIAQAEELFRDLDASSGTRAKLGIAKADLKAAREALRPYHQEMEFPLRDYAAILCGVPIDRLSQSVPQEAPAEVFGNPKASGDDDGNDDA